ncbi:MAG: hypothetical protein ACKO2P_03305 [Planctomycetota bacterium]
MTTALHSEMHQDHLVWKSESGLWCDEVELWNTETDQMEQQLREMLELLGSHREALRDHRATIDRRRESEDLHELQLALYEMGEAGLELPGLAKVHQQTALEQVRQRDAHARLRRYHHTLATLCMMLSRASRAPL